MLGAYKKNFQPFFLPRNTLQYGRFKPRYIICKTFKYLTNPTTPPTKFIHFYKIPWIVHIARENEACQENFRFLQKEGVQDHLTSMTVGNDTIQKHSMTAVGNDTIQKHSMTAVGNDTIQKHSTHKGIVIVRFAIILLLLNGLNFAQHVQTDVVGSVGKNA
jgi:hypothetical protein